MTSLLGFLLSYEPIGEPIDEDDRRRCIGDVEIGDAARAGPGQVSPTTVGT